MTSLRRAERRRERRYIVCGVECTIDGQPSHIIDVSRTAARLVRPPTLSVSDRAYTLTFRLPEVDGDSVTYRVTARFIRQTDTCIVLGFEPPCAHWETLLHVLDTFEMTRLMEI
jgi:hypothetical protein